MDIRVQLTGFIIRPKGKSAHDGVVLRGGGLFRLRRNKVFLLVDGAQSAVAQLINPFHWHGEGGLLQLALDHQVELAQPDFVHVPIEPFDPGLVLVGQPPFRGRPFRFVPGDGIDDGVVDALAPDHRFIQINIGPGSALPFLKIIIIIRDQRFLANLRHLFIGIQLPSFVELPLVIPGADASRLGGPNPVPGGSGFPNLGNDHIDRRLGDFLGLESIGIVHRGTPLRHRHGQKGHHQHGAKGNHGQHHD